MYWFLLIAVAVVVAYYWSSRRQLNVRPRGYAPITIESTPDTPGSFGFKNSWLAIRTDEPEAVLAALSIGRFRAANWRTGVAAAYQTGVFVSPPVEGWVLVVSREIPGLGSDSDTTRWGRALTPLANRFQEVQYFTTHRIVDYHAWAQFEQGELIRAFAWLGESGETLEDFGNPTDEEIELGFAAFDSLAAEVEDGESEDRRAPTEADVMVLAGLWSVDPSELHTRTEEGLGRYSEESPFQN
jgi:hypothetical protein